MIYSTDLANQVTLNNNSSNTKYLEAGIHDNVKFTSVKTAVSPTGKNFIEFRFEKDGKFTRNGNLRNVQKILKNRTRIRRQIRLRELIVS